MLASLVSGVMGGAALGLLLGMKHALEPDHLMAVSALVLDRDGQRESHLAAAPLTQRSSPPRPRPPPRRSASRARAR